MGRAQAFSFIISWELVSFYHLCGEPYVLSVGLHLLYLLLLCEMWFLVSFYSYEDMILDIIYGWVICEVRYALEQLFYSHAQGMIVITKLNPYNIMSPCFANDFVLYISCHINLWHPLPICGFPLICATCLICTHLEGDAFFVTWYDLLFANLSVVI